MTPPRYPWFDRSKRREQLDDHIERERMTNFGFHRVAAQDKVRWVTRHFDRVAPKYDFMNTLLSFGIHHLWKRNAVRWMRLLEGDRVLDVCGGTGDLALLAARAVGPRGHVVVCDINRAMMQAGRPKVASRGLEDRIRFVQGDAERLAFPDASFDAVMVGFGIRNVTRPQDALNEAFRVLRPGGRLMVLEFSQLPNPAMQKASDLYSFNVIPRMGQAIAGDRDSYQYLVESIRNFPDQETFLQMVRSAGFENAKYRNLSMGIACLHSGWKL